MTSVSTQLLLVLISLFLVSAVVEAVGEGDAITLLSHVVVSAACICACLSASARKRNEET
ncbi:small integral membrane protein 30-like [Marmota marmota marmota]|uniref:small integral membrane protein 30-like n=1 Tax=Marmota marmota marmota TaxID=9994 RepID=UPI0020925904|nr:small integral membrane protein 30-like [Marmota marmota marmota]